MKIKIYKCELCGNIVMKLNDKSEALVCCGKPMGLLKANTTDGAKEKHVPVINNKVEGCADAYQVQVGSVLHPMLPEHFINWVGSFNNSMWVIKWLQPGEEPKCNLRVEKNSSLYEYCNIHGLWKK